MQKNVASQKLIVYAFDSTTNLPKTGDAANITAYVSKDYGSVTVLADTSATEMSSGNAAGFYLFDLAQTETNGDTLLFSAKSSMSNIVVIASPATVFTTSANDIADAMLDRSNGIETGYTPRQVLRLLAAAMAGKSSGHASGAPIYRSITDAKDRITATTDSSGNRSVVTLDGT